MFEKIISYHAALCMEHAQNLSITRHAECTATKDSGHVLNPHVRNSIEKAIGYLQGVLKTDDKLKEKADA